MLEIGNKVEVVKFELELSGDFHYLEQYSNEILTVSNIVYDEEREEDNYFCIDKDGNDVLTINDGMFGFLERELNAIHH